MIDFRYHLVSLISVFLALAVGIALGAGPLKESIGDVLTGQVEQLRTDKAALRSQLDAAHLRSGQDTEVLEALAPQLLTDALPGRRVAVVILDDVPAEQVTQVSDALVLAGAEVTAQVTITDRWTDPAQKVFRQALATSVDQFLEPSPGASASTETLLAEALAQGLASSDPADPDVLAGDAALLIELLSSEDSALIELAAPVTRAADGIVFLLAGPDEPVQTPQRLTAAAPSSSPSMTPAVDPDVVASRTELVIVAQARTTGVVVGSAATAEGDLVQVIRSGESLAAQVSTVSDLDTVAGRITLVLALNARMGGQVGHYGFDKGATAPTATRIALDPIDRTPRVMPELSGLDGTGTDDATSGDGTDGADAS